MTQENLAFHLGGAGRLEALQGDPSNVGPWLALRETADGGYEVLARGASAGEALQKARGMSVEMPVITKIPGPQDCLFV